MPVIPYRNRVEIFAVNNRNEIFGGIFNDDKTFAIPGGGVETGESLLTAAIREFLEETGYSLVNPAVMPVAPAIHDWAPATVLKKGYRGSRTYFVSGVCGNRLRGDDVLDKWGVSNKDFYRLDDAIVIQAEEKQPLCPEHFKARLKCLNLLKL